MAKSKSTNVIHMRSWVVAHGGGEAAWQRVLAAASQEDREALENLVAVGWIDLALQHRTLRLIDTTLGTSDLRLATQIGRYEADQDLRGIHRLFLRLANPAFVLEKAGEYWSRFYDSGRWEITRLSPTSARGALRGLAILDEGFCEYLRSYIDRMFQLVGAQGLVTHHVRCRCRGEDACVYQGSWR